MKTPRLKASSARPFTNEQIERFIFAIRNISSGGTSGPEGLEGVAMALAGEGPPGRKSVNSGLGQIAASLSEIESGLVDAIREVAEGLQAVATAIKGAKE